MSLASVLIKLNLKYSSPKMSSPITEYQQERSPVWETRIRSFHQSESCATLFPSMPLESFSFLTSFSLQDRYSRKNVYLFNNSENRTSEEFMLAQYIKSWFCFLPLLSEWLLSRAHVTFSFLSQPCPKDMFSGCRTDHSLGKSCIWLFNNKNNNNNNKSLRLPWWLRW